MLYEEKFRAFLNSDFSFVRFSFCFYFLEKEENNVCLEGIKSFLRLMGH